MNDWAKEIEKKSTADKERADRERAESELQRTDLVLARVHYELLIKRVVPQVLHIFPIANDSVFDLFG